MYDAIMDYGFGFDPPELPQILNSVFHVMKPTIDGSVRFEQKQYENGCKGGRPPKNPKETQNNPSITQNSFGGNLDIDVDIASAFDNEKTVDSKAPTGVCYGGCDDASRNDPGQDAGELPEILRGGSLD